jgi:pyruvate formate lyase activating enzyme
VTQVVQVNFGGFVDTSTVDWPGRAVCTVFLRGCPLRCSYCHNAAIQSGERLLDTGEVIAMIASARMLISGVVFSGGEPTLQKEPLAVLARAAKGMGLMVGIHTNGYYPETLAYLISERLVDRVALDYKTRWEGYSKRWEGYGQHCREDYTRQVRTSLALCREAHARGTLREFEVVMTIFWGNEEDVFTIAREAAGVDLVLQQGVYKRSWKSGREKKAGDRSEPGETGSGRAPYSLDELRMIADRIGRPVRIRTHEGGETVYAGDRGCRAACQR